MHPAKHKGQQGQPSITLNLKPGDQRSVEVDLLYSSDAIPPQILTTKTLGN
ncbi:MAG: DUF3370 family protein [Candidatus Parcubacteria bacterium]|nr:DUF3370 family protein [Leptolyngbyaceae cyanobacterium LF-bin-113]